MGMAGGRSCQLMRKMCVKNHRTLLVLETRTKQQDEITKKETTSGEFMT
jgi:hypothetical protein